MRSAAALLVVLALVPVAIAGTDPRLEQERLTAADMALARAATLQRGDLAGGWRRMTATPQDGTVPSCPGYRPDFSKFTITGKSQSAFQHVGGATILSHVEVYRSRAQAVADFRLGTQPPVARCLGRLLEEGLGGAQGFTAKVVSSRQVTAPRLGERSAAYRVVAEVTASGTTVKLYLDMVVIQRGRSIGGLFFTGAFQPVEGQAALARAVAARLR
jgi:hypothetical protein